MAYKQSHDSQASYTDNLRVKISEHYKPPHRINLAMTYSQRLNLNKQIEDTLPKYEFSLEKRLKDSMKELRKARATMFEERTERLKSEKELVQKLISERLEAEKQLKEEQEIKCIEESVSLASSSTYNTVPISTATNHNYAPQYSTVNSILMPTQATTYSNILTPIPLTNYAAQNCISNPVDKSPFNISDFEADTSSPFDNMELKSINDMEELAQVLKIEDSSYRVNNYNSYPVQNNISTVPPSYSNYIGNQYAYIPNTISYISQASTHSQYSHSNGYYSNSDHSRTSINQPYMYSGHNIDNFTYNSELNKQTSKSNFKSVPDIMKALENELESSVIRNNSIPAPIRPKSTDAVYPKAKIKPEEDVLNSLGKQDQELCESVASMGFPVQRVARVCKILGSDNKKIVDHLLVLSELLDLGFPEKDVSNALIQCNNDKDKALDKLIS